MLKSCPLQGTSVVQIAKMLNARGARRRNGEAWTEEGKHAILFAATILAARKLSETKPGLRESGTDSRRNR
jgi:hypothetical protein